MKKLLSTVFGTLLLAAPALAENSPAKAANNMATAQVAIGAVATKLVAARAGRLQLQVQCLGPVYIGGSSSVTTLTGFPLPPVSPPAFFPVAMTFNNYAGAMYAIVTAAASCNVLEIY
jgi:hypothetical protein